MRIAEIKKERELIRIKTLKLLNTDNNNAPTNGETTLIALDNVFCKELKDSIFSEEITLGTTALAEGEFIAIDKLKTELVVIKINLSST